MRRHHGGDLVVHHAGEPRRQRAVVRDARKRLEPGDRHQHVNVDLVAVEDLEPRLGVDQRRPRPVGAAEHERLAVLLLERVEHLERGEMRVRVDAPVGRRRSGSPAPRLAPRPAPARSSPRRPRCRRRRAAGGGRARHRPASTRSWQARGGRWNRGVMASSRGVLGFRRDYRVAPARGKRRPDRAARRPDAPDPGDRALFVALKSHGGCRDVPLDFATARSHGAVIPPRKSGDRVPKRPRTRPGQ